MSREKNEPARGRPIQLRGWFLDSVKLHCNEWTNDEIAEKLNAAARPARPFTRSMVSDFLLGKVTTVEMMGAFLVLFPTLPAPVLWASSYEEADQLRQVSQRYQQSENVPTLTKTAEDYDAEPRPDTATKTTEDHGPGARPDTAAKGKKTRSKQSRRSKTRPAK